jgi:flagellar hook-length control protein FliK
VQVVAKNGGITAQISAENENVRGIIENQLVTLKESLNEQGIKVDSVEVTVSNFGFEQNLNEQGEQSKEQAKHSNRVRKSLLEEINGVISEDVSEETRMETVGNTVSYKA